MNKNVLILSVLSLTLGFKSFSQTIKADKIKTLSEDPEANAAEIRWREHQIAALQDIINKFESPDG